MAKLTLAQILTDLAQYGRPGDKLIDVAAVVWGESGGDTQAVNVNADGSRDRGAFQINDRAHPEVSDAKAFDWRSSIAAAKVISHDWSDLSPWSVTRSSRWGSIKDEVTKAAKPIADKNTGTAVLDQVTGAFDKLVPGNPFSGLVDVLQTLSGLTVKLLGALLDPDFWKRLGLGLAGVALIIVGVLALRPDLAAKVGGLAAGGPLGASIATAATAGA